MRVYVLASDASNAMKSSNPHSGIHEATVTTCLDTSCLNPTCNQGGVLIVVDRSGESSGRQQGQNH